MMAAVVERENMKAAWRRVEANKGAAGVDGMTVAALRPYLMEHWPRIKAELLAGRYQPSPVRGVEIPKPGGGMRRKLRCMLWRQWKRNYTRAKKPDEAWFRKGAGLQIGHEWPRPVVERRSLAHE